MTAAVERVMAKAKWLCTAVAQQQSEWQSRTAPVTLH